MNIEVGRGRRKVRKGVVVSNKMDKTVVVSISRSTRHAKFGKVLKQTVKCYAHDEAGTAKVGDEVVIMETRPISKLKCWRVVTS